MIATLVTEPTLGSGPGRGHVASGQPLDSSGHHGRVTAEGRRSAASALLLARLGAEHGVDPATTLAGTGLDLDALRMPGAEVTGRQELTLLRNLQAACPLPELALEAGRRYHLTTYGIWGFALASSPTVRDALAVGSTFVDLSFTFCRLAVEQDEQDLRLCLDDDDVPEDVRAFVVARDLAGLRTLAGELAPGLALQRLTVRLPPPRDTGPWAETFGVTPEFDASRNVAVLAAAVLDLALPQADELTAAMTERQCRELVERRRSRVGVAGAVRDELVRTPGAMPALRGGRRSARDERADPAPPAGRGGHLVPRAGRRGAVRSGRGAAVDRFAQRRAGGAPAGLRRDGQLHPRLHPVERRLPPRLGAPLTAPAGWGPARPEESVCPETP
jgi:hypothetical protein